MDKEYMQKTIEHDVLPKLGEFMEEESSFTLYVEYENRKSGVKTIISPAPPSDHIEEVMQQVAREIYKNTDMIPAIVIACEKIQYAGTSAEEITPDALMDSIKHLKHGIVVVAMEAATADGFVELRDDKLNKLGDRDFNKDTSDEAPPYTLLAIASFMRETLDVAGVVKNKTKKEEPENVQFRFSRN